MKTKLKLVREAFDKLRWVFDASYRNYALELFEQCRKEEKSHRGFGSDFAKHHPNAASVADIARMFAVQRVAGYLLKPESFPKGQNYLHYQTSCFIAAGIADEFRDKILVAWTFVPIGELAELDYIKFVSPEKI